MTKLQLAQIIGDELNVFLSKTGMERNQFCEKIGISQTSLSKFIAPSKYNKPIPGTYVMNKILNYFGYEITYTIKPIRINKIDRFNKTHKLEFEEESK